MTSNCLPLRRLTERGRIKWLDLVIDVQVFLPVSRKDSHGVDDGRVVIGRHVYLEALGVVAGSPDQLWASIILCSIGLSQPIILAITSGGLLYGGRKIPLLYEYAGCLTRRSR